jgi:FKBP-type peptidyl-prolyl cis-trans isomerase
MKSHLLLLMLLMPALAWGQFRHEGETENGKKVATHEWFNAQDQKIAEVNYGPAGEVLGFKTWDDKGYLIDDERLPEKRDKAELPPLELTFAENGFGWLIVHGRADAHAPQARTGERVGIFYQGLLQDGTIFDQNYGAKKPFRFKLNMGEVIPGFDAAVAMLRVGEEGYFLIPADLAYKGQVAGIIPPFSDLLFRIKLVELN